MILPPGLQMWLFMSNVSPECGFPTHRQIDALVKCFLWTVTRVLQAPGPHNTLERRRTD